MTQVLFEEAIKTIFDWYVSPIKNIEYKGKKVILEMEDNGCTQAYGSKTIDYLWNCGYRVEYWNMADGINKIGFTLAENKQ